MTYIGAWSRDHHNGKNAMVRRREWGDFIITAGYQPVDAPGRGHTIFGDAKNAADAATDCRQPCSCPPWTGPTAALYGAGDETPLLCHICHQPLTVSEGPAFVGAVVHGEAPPQDADHAGYTLQCTCGEEYSWLYWAMPKRMGRAGER